MTDRPLITDEELHAYIDGELDPLRAADVAVLIQYRPELQARVAAFRADKALLTQAYGPLVDEPIPAHWQAMIDARRSGGRPVLARRAMFAAAASAAVAFAGWSTYSRLRGDADDTIIAEALSARGDAIAGAQPVPEGRETTDRMLKTALSLQIKAPDMAKLGFEIASARVYAGVPGGNAVRLDYRDGQGRMFTVYLRHTTGGERFDMLKRGSVRVCIWQDEVLSAVMLAEVSAGEMLRLASLAYDGLSA